VGPPRGPVLDVGTSDNLSCAVTLDKQQVCWGHASGAPTIDVPPGKYLEVDVLPGGNSACYLREDHTLGCWGDLPAGVVVPSGTFQHLAFPCALRTDGKLACFTQVEALPEETFSEIVSLLEYGCGLRTNGTMVCWKITGPPPPPGLDGSFVGLVVQYGQELCGLRQDGSVTCRRCITADTCKDVSQAELPAGPFTSLFAYQICSCGRDQQGHASCWSFLESSGCAERGADLEGKKSWGYCLEDARGVLTCSGTSPHLSIDLDHP
jgi:hypothetical protein